MAEEIINPQIGMSNTKRVILILLTIFILGPLVFIGACFPVGMFTLGSGSGGGFFVAIIIGLALAIFICGLIIKKINSK